MCFVNAIIHLIHILRFWPEKLREKVKAMIVDFLWSFKQILLEQF